MAIDDFAAALQAYENGDQTALLSLLQGMNLPLTSETSQFLINEEDMAAASGKSGLFKGFYLPSGDSHIDFYALVSWADQFAAITGNKYYPTPEQLQWGVEHGVVGEGQDAAFRWFSMLAGTTEKMPWAATGMTQQAWNDKQQSYADIVQELAGDRGAAGPTVQQAMRERWSQQRFRETLLNDPNFTGGRGYLKWGYTYDTWQQYKRENRQQTIQRFGPGSDQGDANYLKMLEQPLQSVSASGGPVSVSSAATGPLASNQSAVR